MLSSMLLRFSFYTKSPPTVRAITIGAILIAPKVVNNFPNSLIVAPLSNMSSTSRMLFPAKTPGLLNENAPLTLSDFK